MKITCISDTHNQHTHIPPGWLEGGDVLVHAGDISGGGSLSEVEEFLVWFNELPYTHKIMITGNHDFWFEKISTFAVNEMLQEKYPNIVYLNDSGIEIDGVKFWGSPVQPWFYDWAFNRMGTDICRHWDMIPLDTDVLITHGPMKDFLDISVRGVSTGCPYLLEKSTEMTNLKLFVCGHIHEAYGKFEFPDGGVFVNASTLNFNHQVQNKPIVVEINK
jgi:Icc-related predicted phosphoesterase